MTIYQIGDKQVVHPDGFEWGVFPFGWYDFECISNHIVKDGIKTILEIGGGLSSLLLSQLCHVDTLENNKEWYDKLCLTRGPVNDLGIFWWDWVSFPSGLPEKYDAVFIDGPEEQDQEKYKKLKYVGLPREVSYENAPQKTDLVFAHDAYRFAEMSFQIRYLAPHFIVNEIVRSDNTDYNRFMAVWKRVKT